MNSKYIALGLVALTAVAVVVYPAVAGPNAWNTTPPEHPPTATQASKIEVVFALDTTGSMSGLIETAKDKIWSIANSMAQAQNAPEIRIGLVAYRDRGDAYVTRVTDLAEDLDSVYATLMDYEANGGGDTPESVNAALAAAINDVSWTQGEGVYRVVFLVGDAPPHTDYQDEPGYPEILRQAIDRGIVVNTIRCGSNGQTERVWQQIAGLAQGQYFSVDQAGGAVAVATPFDEELAELSRELDETRTSYGDAAVHALAAGKEAATEKLHAMASVASRARRAAFNALESGRKNLFGDYDLVTAIEEGEIELAELEEEDLPEPMRAMAPAARQAYVEEQSVKREALKARIDEVVATRDAYIEKNVSDVSDSLDQQLFDIVKKQAEAKGLRYEEGAAPKL
jgi:Mg-chelatase subunit ChlD